MGINGNGKGKLNGGKEKNVNLPPTMVIMGVIKAKKKNCFKKEVMVNLVKSC